ncbi:MULTISPECIES: hypothetical protein [unclassified Pseudoalteromonas]|jgi:hypothetical protein|uniref:hypothetical protein n=1 Tax=unclassified Pseudoalteromonas TaxID=194690 RepID=UPI0025736038|nr:hypothetical protein [Pseudoalteromonas sp. MM1]BED91303.1 hypothetical protein PspMM1_37710 [Pseudoalteromonas sp. MM1]
MTKTQKLRDKQIRQALTNACEQIKATHYGFAYLTHTVDLKNEAKSLKISCYFEDDVAYHDTEAHFSQLVDIINAELSKISLPVAAKQVAFLVD